MDCRAGRAGLLLGFIACFKPVFIVRPWTLFTDHHRITSLLCPEPDDVYCVTYPTSAGNL